MTCPTCGAELVRYDLFGPEYSDHMVACPEHGPPPYEPPTVTPIGNLRDLVAAGRVEPPAGVAGVCRVCGCTDARPCVVAGGELVDVADGSETLQEGTSVCAWIEPDLCSACVQDKAPPLSGESKGAP